MASSKRTRAGLGYIILNTLRVMNVIGFLAVITASVVMLVKTFVRTKYFFFDAVSHVITALVSMFLIASELSLFRNYFARNWPVLSPAHGLVSLGIAMIVLGVNILGNLNKEATSQKSLGLAFWRIVIGSGIVVFILGFLNVVASYVFRDRSLGVTARQIRSKGAVAMSAPQPTPLDINTSFPSAMVAQSTFSTPKKSPVKTFSPARTFRQARSSILPSYHTTSPARPPYPVSDVSSSPTSARKNKKDNRQSVGPKVPVNISAPLNVNPQFAHLVRPDLAHHPSQRRGEGNGWV